MMYYVLHRDWGRLVPVFLLGLCLTIALFSFAHLRLNRVAGLTYQLTVHYSRENGVSYINHYFSWLGHGAGSGTNRDATRNTSYT